MRKHLLLFAAAIALAVVTSTAPANTQGAIVINDGGCALLNGDGGGVVADSSHAVVTPSGNGVLVCKVKGVANSTGRAVRFDFASTGLSCGTAAGSTQDWHETVSASGNATLVCNVQP